jgi:hypothetical protein
LGTAAAQLIGDVAPLLACGLRVVLCEGRGDEGATKGDAVPTSA